MSARSGRAFLPALREVDRRLPAPIPERVRILRELEHDLDALQARLEARGMSRDEARAAAEEALVPDAAVLDQLGRVHEPAYVRLTRRVSDDTLRRAERGTLALATLVVLAAAGVRLAGAPFARDPSVFLWPVLALGLAALLVAVAKAFQLWVRRDHRRPATGLGAVLLLAGATLVVGAGGAFWETYALASLLERAPELTGPAAEAWLVRTSSLLVVALLLALTSGLAWFALRHWLSLVVGARRELLALSPDESVLHSHPSEVSP